MPLCFFFLQTVSACHCSFFYFSLLACFSFLGVFIEKYLLWFIYELQLFFSLPPILLCMLRKLLFVFLFVAEFINLFFMDSKFLVIVKRLFYTKIIILPCFLVAIFFMVSFCMFKSLILLYSIKVWVKFSGVGPNTQQKKSIFYHILNSICILFPPIISIFFQGLVSL